MGIIKRDLSKSKVTHTRDLYQYKRDLQMGNINTSKGTYIHQKRLTKETCFKQKRPTQETCTNTQEIYKKGPIYFKKDINASKGTTHTSKMI